MEWVAASSALASRKCCEWGKKLWKAAMLFYTSVFMQFRSVLRWYTSRRLCEPLHAFDCRCSLHHKKTLLHSRLSFPQCCPVEDVCPACNGCGPQDRSLNAESSTLKASWMKNPTGRNLQLALSKARRTSTSTSVRFTFPKIPGNSLVSSLPGPAISFCRFWSHRICCLTAAHALSSRVLMGTFCKVLRSSFICSSGLPNTANPVAALQLFAFPSLCR